MGDARKAAGSAPGGDKPHGLLTMNASRGGRELGERLRARREL